MLETLKSASKIVLLLFAAAIVVGLFAGKVSEDTFKTTAAMVFVYYFTVKGNTAEPITGVK